MLVAWISKREGGRILPLSLSFSPEPHSRDTNSLFAGMVCAGFSVLFTSFSLPFLLLQMKLVSRPVLKVDFFSSQLSNLVLVVRMRHSGRLSSPPSLLPISPYQPLITNPSPPPHHMIIWVFPLSNQKQLHQLSRIACTIPHFPLSSPLFYFPPAIL